MVTRALITYIKGSKTITLRVALHRSAQAISAIQRRFTITNVTTKG